MARPRGRLRASLAALGLLASGGTRAADHPRLDACDAAIDLHASASARASFRCYYMAARTGADWDEAVRRLDAHAADPHGAWAELSRAHIASDRDEPDTEARYRRVMARFDEEGDALGGVYARLGLSTWLSYGERYDELFAVLDEAEALAGGTDRATRLSVKAQRARQLVWAGSPQLALAEVLALEPQLHPDDPYQLRIVVHHVHSAAANELGLQRESMLAAHRVYALARDHGDRYVAATARLNEAVAAMGDPLLASRPPGPAALARDAFELARSAGNRYTEAGAACTLGEALGREGGTWLERGVEGFGALGAQEDQAQYVAALALLRYEEDPEAGLALAREALRLAEAADPTNPSRPLAGFALAWLLGREGREAEARAAEAGVLDAIEQIRDVQLDPDSQAWIASAWAMPYYDLAGREKAAGDLAGAFATLERLRANTLLEAMARAHIAVPEALRARHAEALRRLNEAGQVADEGRDENALPALELEELAAREALAAAADPRVRPVAPDEVRRALAPDEALVAIQLAHGDPTLNWLHPDWRTPAWALVITREGMRAVDLPPMEDAQAAVDAWIGLVGARDGSESALTPALVDALVRPWLDALPAGISRVALVVDQPAARLSFPALLAAAGRPELATSQAASASTWLARRRTGPPAGAGVLALADPTLPGAGAAWPRLPAARREARVACGQGDRCEPLSGALATEDRVVGADWSRLAVLHLGTHTAIETTRPDRTALLFAPGTRDGRLQVSEIRALPLHGQVVVLSGCATATGLPRVGEGTFGLVRAFLEAGARAVVATSWAVRDRDAAAWFAAFYERLGEGSTVAAAARDAASHLRAEGRPLEAWAAPTVYGDGAARPLPARAGVNPLGISGLSGAFLLLLAGLFRLRGRAFRAARVE